MAAIPIKVPSELFALAESSHFEGEYQLDVLEVGPDDYRFEEPVSWSVDVTNTGAALLVAGIVSGSAICACSRCLEDVPHSFEGDIEGYYLIGADQHAVEHDGEEELGEDEFEVLPADHIIDLLPLVETALRVDAPVMPLCKEDCAGLCPTCGANLNDGMCECGPDEALEEFDRASNPFSALAGLAFE